MIEELRVIAEIFKSATDSALYAYLAFILFQLAKVSLYVFPIVGLIKFAIKKIFIGGNDENSQDK